MAASVLRTHSAEKVTLFFLSSLTCDSIMSPSSSSSSSSVFSFLFVEVDIYQKCPHLRSHASLCRVHRTALLCSVFGTTHTFSNSNMAPLSPGVAPPLDGRGVSPGEWKFASLKSYQKISGENGNGCPVRRASRGDHSPFGLGLKKNANVFPVDCELCLFFMWSYLDVQKFIQLMSGQRRRLQRPLHPLFNVRKITYSTFFFSFFLN